MAKREVYESANDGKNRLVEETLSDGSKVYNVEVRNHEGYIVVLACPSYNDAMTLHLTIKDTSIVN
jgi:hypothetical protein